MQKAKLIVALWVVSLSTLIFVIQAGAQPAIRGSGTAGFIPKFTTPHIIGNSTLFDTGSNVGIGTLTPYGQLQVSSGRDFRSPQVVITQTTPFDFARLQYQSFGIEPDSNRLVPFALWDIAEGCGVMNFFSQGTGNVMTLTSAREPGTAFLTPRVGINTEHPQTTLDVNGTATVNILQITGGGDLAESFAVEEHTSVEPGTVMVIDKRHPGKLKISTSAYDRKVAGIVSGAGGVQPGVMLQQGQISEGNTQVALAGRVYCMAEALSHPIEPGDLLTTSNLPGQAMKVTDHAQAQGAIIGKAMSALKEGNGLVLVLVNLQ